jgi:hypothetical protein
VLVSKSNKFRFQQAVARTPHKPQVDNAKTATLEAGRYLDASPPRLILEIDIRKLLPAGRPLRRRLRQFLDRPGRREAALATPDGVQQKISHVAVDGEGGESAVIGEAVAAESQMLQAPDQIGAGHVGIEHIVGLDLRKIPPGVGSGRFMGSGRRLVGQSLESDSDGLLEIGVADSRAAQDEPGVEPFEERVVLLDRQAGGDDHHGGQLVIA